MDNADLPTWQQIEWIFKKLHDHYKEGGTYRCLLDRLENRISYCDLDYAGGMTIHNALWRDRQAQGGVDVP